MRRANVYINNVLAGVIVENNRHDYIFRYDNTYYQNRSNPPVSLTLPLTRQEYRSTHLFPFFSNMLSEGSNRRVQSRFLKIDENDNFGLLLATAQYDTPGAITIKPIK